MDDRMQRHYPVDRPVIIVPVEVIMHMGHPLESMFDILTPVICIY